MARVLFVTANVPARDGGGAMASLAFLQALHRRGWDVHLVLSKGDPELALCEDVRAVCREISLPKLRPVRTPWAPGAWCLLRYGYWPRFPPGLWEVVRPLLRSPKYDLLLLDHLRVVELGRFAKEEGFTIPIVLREHNVEFEFWLRALPFLHSARLLVEALPRIRRWRAIESNLARYCDLVLPISSVDATKLSELNPGFPVEPIPSPVDTDHFHPRSEAAEGKELVFIGGLRWRPNEDGIRWFVEEVLPAVRARHPDAHLTVIGDSPPEWLRCHPHVRAVGFVADERELLARARVVIVPIRYGSGIRMKILHSLAMGKAVVSTSIGAEGIPVRDRHSILIADDAPAFAEAISTVLEDDGWVVRLGENGLRVCLDHYGPAHLSGRLDDVLRHGLARCG